MPIVIRRNNIPGFSKWLSGQFLLKPVLGLLIIFGIFCCSKETDEESQIIGIEFGKSAYAVSEEGTLQLRIKVITSRSVQKDTAWYDVETNPLGLTWKAAYESVLLVDRKGMVTARKIGSSDIIVTSGDGKLSAKTSITVLKEYSIKPLESELNDQVIYSKEISLFRNSVMQSFDIDSEGFIFYDQLGGSLPQYVYVIRGKANKSPLDFMQLKYFGHGTNIAVEEEGGDRYIWISSNGSKGSDGEYGSSQTISRVKYIPGSIWEKSGGDDFYIPNKFNVHPAIDVKNDLLAITSSGGGDPNRYFYFYKLSQAKALSFTPVTLTAVKYGGEGDGTPEQTETRQIQVRNLGRLTSSGSFGIAPAKNDEQVNYYPFQGFDVADGYLYFYEGEGNDNTGVLPSRAYVTIMDLKGNIIYGRTAVQSISDLSLLNQHGITATGYMEAEGIKVKNETLYLGFASKSTDNLRRANIFHFRIR
jgi:hypothetical protein